MPWGFAIWTTESRARYDGRKLRYPSDLTDDEWRLIEPLIPPAKRGGNKRMVDRRKGVNGLALTARSKPSSTRSALRLLAWIVEPSPGCSRPKPRNNGAKRSSAKWPPTLIRTLPGRALDQLHAKLTLQLGNPAAEMRDRSNAAAA